MDYAPTLTALVAALAIAGIGDAMSGRRGYFGASLVALTGAACGAFLALRVFSLALPEDWSWVLWSVGGAVLLLALYALFRSKR